MTSILEKVRSLIELTTSDNVHEAKTAALQACKIIREHKLEVRLPREPGAGMGRIPDMARESRRRSETIDDIWGKGFADYFASEMKRARQRGQAQQEARTGRAWYDPPPRPKPPPNAAQPQYPRAKPMCTVGSRGPCTKCGEDIPAGSLFVEWREQLGGGLVEQSRYFHPECYPGERW